MEQKKSFWLYTTLVLLALAVVFLIIDRSRYSNLKNEVEAIKKNQPILRSPSDSTSQLLGVDLSHWDGDIDWIELKKDGISFVFIKATQGTYDVDPKFEENWTTAKNYGFYRGAYHFYDPKDDPKAQAEKFLKTIKPEKGDILPVIDIEISGGVDKQKLAKDVEIWVETVKSAIGRYPILYTDKAFWEKSIDADFSHCPIWIAEWQSEHSPYLPKGWKDWTFWQYSATGTVKGIPYQGKVDRDRFNGGEQALRSYLIR